MYTSRVPDETSSHIFSLLTWKALLEDFLKNNSLFLTSLSTWLDVMCGRRLVGVNLFAVES